MNRMRQSTKTGLFGNCSDFSQQDMISDDKLSRLIVEIGFVSIV